MISGALWVRGWMRCGEGVRGRVRLSCTCCCRAKRQFGGRFRRVEGFWLQPSGEAGRGVGGVVGLCMLGFYQYRPSRQPGRRETEPTDSPPPISRPPSAAANGNSWSEWNLRQPVLHSHPAPPLPPPPLTPFPLPPLSSSFLSHGSLDYFKRRLRRRSRPSSCPR